MSKLRWHGPRRWPMLAAIAAAAFVAGGMAHASIPDSNGTIHGCFSTNGAKATNGTQLNIIDSDSASCKGGQEEVTWNGLSPESFASASQSCSSGTFASGIDSSGKLVCATPPPPKLYEAAFGPQDFDSGFITVGTLSIPAAGTYFLTAKVTVQNVYHTSRWQCALSNVDESELVTTGGSLVTDDNFNGTIPLQAKVQFAGAFSIALTCTSSSNEKNRVNHAKIAALRVTS